jgi:hypothetical protein
MHLACWSLDLLICLEEENLLRPTVFHSGWIIFDLNLICACIGRLCAHEAPYWLPHVAQPVIGEV